MATGKTASKSAAKKVAAKQPAAKKAAAKKAAAKTLASVGDALALDAGADLGLNVGDVVMLNNSDGTVLGPGRLCVMRAAFASGCVAFGDGVGCIQVSLARLTGAPSGSQAPNCNGCMDC
jgi:hypothetical protein